MSYRSKRSRNVKASKVNDTATRSVEDILSQVIHDVAAGEIQASEALLNSSCNQADGGVKTMAQPAQRATAEADDVASNKKSTARRQTSSASQLLAADPPRQLRSSLRHSLRSSPSQDSGFQPVHDVADEGVQHPALSSCHTHEAEDPPMTVPVEATNMETNDVQISQRNTSGRQTLAAPATQQHPAGSPRSPSQLKAPKTSSCWVQDDDEPAEQGDSGARHAKLSKWSHEIEFDEMEEVEMRDLDGKRGRKGGKIFPRHVWSLRPGVRFVVPFNALDQPIRKGGYVLVRFLGDVAKNGELCPIGVENWHKVEKSCKANIVALVREKFVLPAREEINREVLKHVSSKWRIYRHRLKIKYKKAGKTQEQVASIVPKGVVPTQWTKLVDYWFSDRSQYLSTRGKEARAAQLHLHTTGSKSFARKRDEFEKVHGREPGALEWFVQTHQRKDGTYVENTSKEFLDTAATMIAQRGAPSSSKERVAIENEVFNELMYSDDDQRPIGYGSGVSRNKVFGIGAELRKRGFLASDTYHTLAGAEGVTRRNKISRVGGEARSSGYLASDTSAEVERLNFAVTAMGETNELMQAQLQMQSKQLKMQSQQLQMQSQQMEGLQFQLQQVTSLLTKFGVMLNKPPINPTPRGVPYGGLKFANARAPPAMHEFSDGESESSEWDSD